MGLHARQHHDLLTRNDHKLLARWSPPEDLEIVGAEGSRVLDARERSLIDFTMGHCVGNLGWNLREVMTAVREFDGPSYVIPGAVYPPWVELAGLLAELAPGRARRAFRAVGGSEAVEQALQIAMTVTNRHALVSIEGAYHGNTFAARSIGAGDVPSLLQGCRKLSPPLDRHALERLDRLLKHRDVAAFIMEPVITNLGVLLPDDDFMRALVTLCHHHGTLVIMDEVACGFGRTGAMFACEHYDVAPDIVCLAKSITNGAAPLGATLVTAPIADACQGQHEFYSTFAWHPIATEAAIATLRYWQQHRFDILANVHARCQQFRRALEDMDWSVEPDVRVRGLAIGIGLGSEQRAEALRERCVSEGLLVGAEGDSLVLFPALTIDEATASEGLEILARCAAAA